MTEVKGKYFHRSAVAQLTNEGIDCLSKIRSFCEGTMVLTEQDVDHLLEAFEAWELSWSHPHRTQRWKGIRTKENVALIMDLKERLVDYKDSFNKKDNG
tara:strand:- start:1280 stop:1576 length:297 start_codon:yes stop_codon:yes gene_type:complete